MEIIVTDTGELAVDGFAAEVGVRYGRPGGDETRHPYRCAFGDRAGGGLQCAELCPLRRIQLVRLTHESIGLLLQVFEIRKRQ